MKVRSKHSGNVATVIEVESACGVITKYKVDVGGFWFWVDADDAEEVTAKTWRLSLLSPVVIKCSGELGEVIARAEYADSCDRYLVRYKAANGCASECWWDDSALTVVSKE